MVFYLKKTYPCKISSKLQSEFFMRYHFPGKRSSGSLQKPTDDCDFFMKASGTVEFYRFPILPINKDTNCKPSRYKLKWDNFHQSSVFSKVIIFSINTLLGVILHWVHHSLGTHTHLDAHTCTHTKLCLFFKELRWAVLTRRTGDLAKI